MNRRAVFFFLNNEEIKMERLIIDIKEYEFFKFFFFLKINKQRQKELIRINKFSHRARLESFVLNVSLIKIVSLFFNGRF